MITFDQFAEALGEIESENNPDVRMGDGHRAIGRWQCHIDRLFDEAKRHGLYPKLGEKFDDFVRRVLDCIFDAHPHFSPVETAMYWHLGHYSFPASPDWDHGYANRFTAALEKVCNSPTPSSNA